jgi:hypothetical protein
MAVEEGFIRKFETTIDCCFNHSYCLLIHYRLVDKQLPFGQLPNTKLS